MTAKTATRRKRWTPARKAIAGFLFAAAIFAFLTVGHMIAGNPVQVASFAVLTVTYLGLTAVFHVLT
jgi:hypothetical protein